MVNPRKSLLQRIASKYGRNHRKNSYDGVTIEMQETTNNIKPGVEESDFEKGNYHIIIYVSINFIICLHILLTCRNCG